MFLLSKKYFLNFGGNKNKYCNLSDMNFFIKNMKNIKNRYSDPDPLWTRIRIHFFQTWIRIRIPYYGKVDPDPYPLFPNVDSRIRTRIHVKMRWIRNAASKDNRFYCIVIPRGDCLAYRDCPLINKSLICHFRLPCYPLATCLAVICILLSHLC